MNVLLNGAGREVTAATLEDVLNELGYRNSVIAIAVNGHFIAKSARRDLALAEGDRIEVVAPMQGG